MDGHTAAVTTLLAAGANIEAKSNVSGVGSVGGMAWCVMYPVQCAELPFPPMPAPPPFRPEAEKVR